MNGGRRLIGSFNHGSMANALLRQLHLPVKVVVFNNGALAFVDLEMKSVGIVNFGTDLDNPNFAEVARAIGLFGVRVEHPSELDKALHEALDHDGPAVIEVMTVRHELQIPPGLTFSQAAGFALWGTRSILSGDGKDIIDTTKSKHPPRRGRIPLITRFHR